MAENKNEIAENTKVYIPENIHEARNTILKNINSALTNNFSSVLNKCYLRKNSSSRGWR